MIRRSSMMLLVSLALCIAAGAPASASIKSEAVVYKQGDTELHGYLVYDADKQGKRPGVLVVHEWWGLNDHSRDSAEELARQGYVALAVDMYGEGKSTEHPQQAGEWATWIRSNKEVGAARFQAGYDLLAAHELTNEDQIAAIGYCFGGSVVLTMAMNGADLKGVVSFHGGLPTEPVPVDEINAKILVCHGGADGSMSHEQVQTFLGNLDAVEADYQFIIYSGAQHGFTRRSPAYDADADRRSWDAMWTFFGELFEE